VRLVLFFGSFGRIFLWIRCLFGCDHEGDYRLFDGLVDAGIASRGSCAIGGGFSQDG
jgi:hypothetical protein